MTFKDHIKKREYMRNYMRRYRMLTHYETIPKIMKSHISTKNTKCAFYLTPENYDWIKHKVREPKDINELINQAIESLRLNELQNIAVEVIL